MKNIPRVECSGVKADSVEEYIASQGPEMLEGWDDVLVGKPYCPDYSNWDRRQQMRYELGRYLAAIRGNPFLRKGSFREEQQMREETEYMYTR